LGIPAFGQNRPKIAFIVGESALFGSKTASLGGPKKAIFSDIINVWDVQFYGYFSSVRISPLKFLIDTLLAMFYNTEQLYYPIEQEMKIC